MTAKTDPAAAAVHRQRAEAHYAAAVRLERAGLADSAAAARRQAHEEDAIADVLLGLDDREGGA